MASTSYDDIVGRFRWQVPEKLNLGVALCDRHAGDPGRRALVYLGDDGRTTDYTFGQIRSLSNKLGNALVHLGVKPGDRVGILLSQRPETGISHVACFKIGAISVPLFTQFGPDAIRHRMSDSGAAVVITDKENVAKVAPIRDALPDLRHVLLVDERASDETLDYWDLIERSSESLVPLDTRADDPALIIYTSGTTGPAKGALHAHRIMEAHKPAIRFTLDDFPRGDDLFWTPAEWAWGGGLLNSLFGSWYSGIAIVAHRFRKFDPAEAFALIARHQVRNAFMPPTALKMMMTVPAASRPAVAMRSMNSGGESLGAETVAWVREAFGLTVNEFWGQTEANFLTGNSGAVMPVKAGSIGRPLPGHRIEIVSEEGDILPTGQTGVIAARVPDPIFFLGYWNNPDATRAKLKGDWLMTGDTGRKDEDGYLWFAGRNDDIISSGAYRIGPGEIESCIDSHPLVLRSAVIGVPDPVRGEIIKAFIVLGEGVETGETTVTTIQAHVRDRLAAYQYPREVEFLEQLPMTPSGKIQRGELRRMNKHERMAPRN